MRKKDKTKKQIHPEIIREQEERRKAEMMYSGEGLKRAVLLYALLAGVNYPSYGFGYSLIIPPVLFMKFFDD
ncbi:MAG: hypothetical protein IKW64_05955 [Clostridia bacterium]|nr:hypothetical protein [Clostridia bacterium]